MTASLHEYFCALVDDPFQSYNICNEDTLLHTIRKNDFQSNPFKYLWKSSNWSLAEVETLGLRDLTYFYIHAIVKSFCP